MRLRKVADAVDAREEEEELQLGRSRETAESDLLGELLSQTVELQLGRSRETAERHRPRPTRTPPGVASIRPQS